MIGLALRFVPGGGRGGGANVAAILFPASQVGGGGEAEFQGEGVGAVCGAQMLQVSWCC